MRIMRSGFRGGLGVWVVLAGVLGGAAFAAAAAGGPVGAVSALADAKVQQDFPATCVDGADVPWVAYVEHDGEADVLKVARKAGAGTDKIVIEFSCNDHLPGSIFETADKPTMKVAVRGTAALKAVTLVRNQTNLKQFTPKKTVTFGAGFRDNDPVAGENRYYIRVEQVDGNMGWTSPVWVTVK